MSLKKIIYMIISIIFYLNITTTFASYSNLTDTDLYSESAILIDSKTGMILYEKNADKKMYPASTTKILTAILALENCNLNDIVTVSQSAVSSIKPRLFRGISY